MGAFIAAGRRLAFAALAIVAASSCDCLGPPAEPPPPEVPFDPLTSAVPSVARRLSQAEVDATLGHLLLDDSAPAARLLLTDAFTPYDNDATTQQSSAALIDSLEALSVDVADRALANDAARALLFPCTPGGADDATCFREIVAATGKRIRRPVRRAHASWFDDGIGPPRR